MVAYEATGDSVPQAFLYEVLPPSGPRFYRVRGANAAGPGPWSEVLRFDMP